MFLSGAHSQQDKEIHFHFMTVSSVTHEAEFGFRVHKLDGSLICKSMYRSIEQRFSWWDIIRNCNRNVRGQWENNPRPVLHPQRSAVIWQKAYSQKGKHFKCRYRESLLSWTDQNRSKPASKTTFFDFYSPWLFEAYLQQLPLSTAEVCNENVLSTTKTPLSKLTPTNFIMQQLGKKLEAAWADQ